MKKVFFITNTKSVSLDGLLCFLRESIGDIRSNMLRKTEATSHESFKTTKPLFFTLRRRLVLSVNTL